MLYEPDGALRERAFRTFLDTLRDPRRRLDERAERLMQDHGSSASSGRSPDPVLPTHLDNEVRPETVDAMMAATERH
jgi:oligoendopeptidase F